MAGLCEGGNDPSGSLKAICRWIGRNGPIAWTARSPDLTPLDFFLWGCMKEKMYQTEITIREELVAKMNTAAMEIHQHGLDNVQREFRRHAEVCVRLVMYRSAMPRRQSSHLQTSLDVEDKELAESVESVRSSSAGGSGEGGDPDKQAPAFSILATSSVSIRDLGLIGADVTDECHKQGSPTGPKGESREQLNLATVVAKELDHLDLSTFPRMFGGGVRGRQVKSARARHHIEITFADV
ncbi:hypothetical protein ANN_02913 [Periplaneta americana]|uniref:Uncharacterized protein n=1 Tax=Periplaneta americana TaxID=6978 RepID=A0ABQ8TXK8_PERAM|nr:hypothetical protein ANN_02913 [Periplaneta americana]